MKQIIDRKVYDTETAERIADDWYKNGKDRLNNGRGNSLYLTKRGNLFSCYETAWKGKGDKIEPLTTSEAVILYKELNGLSRLWPVDFNKVEEA